jgi:hypothetical protein
MPSLSEVVVRELLSEQNSYKDRYTLSIKIANKDLHSQKFSLDEKNEINRILKLQGIPVRLK